MGRLYIMRANAVIGMLTPINCYVNGKLICKLTNDSDFTFQTEDEIVEFKCNSPNSVIAGPVYLDMTAKKFISVEVSPGSPKPQITVLNQDAVVSKPSTIVYTESNAFAPTKIIGNYFAIDEMSHQWAVGNGIFSPFANAVPHQYSDLVSFDLLEDGSSITHSSTKGGLGRALVGGMLFGGTGAVVGGITGKRRTKEKVQQTCTNLEIKITIKDASRPTEYIKLISSSVKRESYTYKSAYKDAQDIISLLELICLEKDNLEKTLPVEKMYPTSKADEIRKYKQLMDEGILSEEEFLAIKKQLLGL